MAPEQDRRESERRIRVGALSVACFRAFLAATKPVERLAERRASGDPVSQSEIDSATSTMWLAWQEVAVLCPEAIIGPAERFAKELHHLANQAPKDHWVENHVGPLRGDLFRIARPIFQELASD